MAPVSGTTTQQRRRTVSEHDAASNSIFVSAPAGQTGKAPFITYARSSKPLSVTGTQFVRRDTYNLPSEDEDRCTTGNGSLQATNGDNCSESSALSDEESSSLLQRVEDVRIIGAPSRHEALQAASPGVSPSKTGIAQAVSEPRIKPTNSKEPNARAGRVTNARSTSKAPIRTSKGSSRRLNTKTPARRLPVNELFCVSSLPDKDDSFDPLSDVPGIDVQDPIRDQSSHDPGAPGTSLVAERRMPQAPLTSIRKRLKTPNFKQKSITSLRRRRNPLIADAHTSSGTAGDGFKPSELEITCRMQIPRQPWKCMRLSALTYGALQLSGGPLPEVTFECGADESQLEVSGGPHHVSAQHQKEEELSELPKSSTQRSRRRVSFSGRDDFIVAQLSSVTAPRRYQSDSEDEDVDEESDIDGDESQIDDAEAIVEGFAGAQEQGDDSELGASETEQAAIRPPIEPRKIPMQAKRKPSIRFTQTEDVEEDELQSGGGMVQHPIAVRPPALSNKKRRLIEVCEAIEDVPDTATQYPREMITIRVNQNHSDGATRSHRTRSILKNSTPIVHESTFHPRDTAANTRRNSVVATDAANGSRYFTSAAEQLDLPDPGRHVIVPRRRSNYSGEAQIQIPDSERAVPETSPEPPEYTNGSQLAVLRKTSENVWTSSQSLPTAAPRGLKALTRNVSREHGTLSQSRRERRRPSLPFQSPSKVLA